MAKSDSFVLPRLFTTASPGGPPLSEDLKIVYEEVEEMESEVALGRRTSAEERVRQVVLDMGERVTHGDLLTFQKFNQARALRSNSLRAVDRSAIVLI